MRLLVLAIGRLKKSAESELAERYLKRVKQAGRAIGLRDIEIVEIKESPASDANRRMTEESIALANILQENAAVVMLDERGENLSSAALAERLRRWRDEGKALTAFVIGGPDGISPTLRDKADLTLAFGAATWPHQLARSMLLEQLYRAVTILSGHPYHRV